MTMNHEACSFSQEWMQTQNTVSLAHISMDSSSWDAGFWRVCVCFLMSPHYAWKCQHFCGGRMDPDNERMCNSNWNGWGALWMSQDPKEKYDRTDSCRKWPCPRMVGQYPPPKDLSAFSMGGGQGAGIEEAAPSSLTYISTVAVSPASIAAWVLS